MKRFFSSYWSILVLLIIGAGAFKIFEYMFMPFAPPLPKRAQCQVHLKEISLAIFMYSQDYDQRLPPAIFSKETAGWANGLQPYLKDNPDYLKSPQIFQCPSEAHPMQVDPHLPSFTDYWINRNVAGADLDKLDFSPNVILMGDGDGGSPASTASYAISGLPSSWRQAENSPAKRHHDGANYALMDGRVKWLKPDQVSQLSSSKNESAYTFSIR